MGQCSRRVKEHLKSGNFDALMFSQRRFLDRAFSIWATVNKALPCAESVFAWLAIMQRKLWDKEKKREGLDVKPGQI